MEQQTAIAQQQQIIQNGTSPLEVLGACSVAAGILSFSDQQKASLRACARQEKPALTFFIPASGSGSRMFEFLSQFNTAPDPKNTQQAAQFLSRLSEFALFQKLPKYLQQAYTDGTLQVGVLIGYLLGPEGLNYSKIPKGLIPFHIHDAILLNPFQEHLLQAALLPFAPICFHFTIQQEFEQDFKSAIQQIEAHTAQCYDVSYSTQDTTTDAFVFKQDGSVLKDQNGQAIRRPAGHGTLLKNLEALKATYILVKNIDNVQHFCQSEVGNANWEFLVGLQLQIRSELSIFADQNDFEGLCSWNNSYGLYDSEWLKTREAQSWKEIINRPLRVCGMVKNEGQPGGGPYFVRKDGQITKQIIEKSQLVQLPNANQLLIQSTHFNPVMMVLSPCDLSGRPHDLSLFKDFETCFVVDKHQGGEKVTFVEQPGLWNGAMANWNTLFVELPAVIFSPVKSVMDLLEYAHLPNKGA